jgi:hypothetical protein
VSHARVDAVPVAACRHSAGERAAHRQLNPTVVFEPSARLLAAFAAVQVGLTLATTDVPLAAGMAAASAVLGPWLSLIDCLSAWVVSR